MTMREKIEKAASRLFRIKGYHGTTVEEIARSVGTKKGSLYYHIAGKEELLVSILSEAIDRAIKRLETIAELQISPLERLRRAVEGHITGVLAHRDAVAVFLKDGDKLSGPGKKDYLAKRKKYEQLFRDLVQAAIKDGAVRGADPSLLTRAILGSCNSVLVWYKPHGPLRADEIATTFTDFIFNGILPWRA